MYILALSVAILSATAFSASAQTDQQIGWCNGEDNASRDRSISGCTAMIDSGAYKGEELAIVLDKRATAYFRNGDFERAIQDYDQAIRLRPNFLNALIGRGFAYLRMKSYDAAIAAFDAALGAYPGNPASFYGRALAKGAKGKTAEANAEVVAVRQLDPSLSQELASLGIDPEAPPELAALSPSAASTGVPSAVPGATPQPAQETASLPPAAAPTPAVAPGGSEAAAPPAPAAEMASVPLPADVADVLVRRGNDLLRTGDIAAARLAFERAAVGGSNTAATGVAKTYDPVFLTQSGVRGLRGDPARAAFWYGKAVAAGSQEAQERLTRLRAQFPQ